MEKIAIIGAGDLGQLIAHHAQHSCGISVAGFFDDTKQEGEMVCGVSVLGGVKTVAEHYKKGVFTSCMLGIGYRHMNERERIFEELSAVIPFSKVIHPSCIIDASVLIGSGCFLLPGCVLDKGVRLGNNVLLNTGCVIAHDTHVQDHSFLSPAVNIAGFSTVGKKCVLGIGTVVIDNLQICAEARTGGGTVVTENIEKPGLYVGIPARFVR
jgi:sugar O-acyltransferase (sialic acid O-acetyltransferase NeuD family)